jgi:hypothetical protein
MSDIYSSLPGASPTVVRPPTSTLPGPGQDLPTFDPSSARQYTPGTRTAPSPDPGAALTGSDRDIFSYIRGILNSWGLGSLADEVVKFIRNDFSVDTIMLELQKTEAYKKRFAGNERRAAAGLPVLDPAEYLAMEDQYREVMRLAGMPIGFYDQTDDFTNFISNDVSPNEVSARVNAAKDVIHNLDPNVRAVVNQWYTDGDLVAYALDPDRAVTTIQQQYETAQIGAEQIQAGFGANQQIAERLQSLGIEADQAASGLQQARTLQQDANRLGALTGDQFSDAEVVAATFEQEGGVTRRIGRLASQERARFGGGAGIGAQTLTSARVGEG